MSTRPAMTSAIAAATPRNGTCSACTPARFSKSSIARCADDPGPPEPKVMPPGCCFASATSSASVRGPSPGRTSRIEGESAIRLICARSRTGSYGRFG